MFSTRGVLAPLGWRSAYTSVPPEYCAAKAEIWEAWDDDDVSTAAKTSCPSRLHQWGIPKRRLIEPDLPVDEMWLSENVSSQKAFLAIDLSKQPRHMHDGAQLLSVPDNKEDTTLCCALCCELTSIHNTDELRALLRYIAESNDSDSGMESIPRHRFDVVRPGPLHYPEFERCTSPDEQ